jgi:hypothetical protein
MKNILSPKGLDALSAQEETAGAPSRFCFYCGVPLVAGGKQEDHFPVPDRHGGVVTVPCCIPCHDLKDRLDVGDWNPEWFDPLLADFGKVGRETKLFMAKALATILDAKHILEERQRRNEARSRPRQPKDEI